MAARQRRVRDDRRRHLEGEPAGEAGVVDATFGGAYARPDEEVLTLWEVAVDEVRELIESGWWALPTELQTPGDDGSGGWAVRVLFRGTDMEGVLVKWQVSEGSRWRAVFCWVGGARRLLSTRRSD